MFHVAETGIACPMILRLPVAPVCPGLSYRKMQANASGSRVRFPEQLTGQRGRVLTPAVAALYPYVAARHGLDEIINQSGHGLTLDELTILLCEMFDSAGLVAMRDGRGLFTPTLDELEAALAQEDDSFHRAITNYGMTCACVEEYRELRLLYGRERR